MALNKFAILLLSLCTFSLDALAMGRHKTVRIQDGLLRGRSEGSTWVFKGIPFAAPPVGDLRWKAPVPSYPWQGVRDAFKEGPQCLQPKTLTAHPKSTGS